MLGEQKFEELGRESWKGLKLLSFTLFLKYFLSKINIVYNQQKSIQQF